MELVEGFESLEDGDWRTLLGGSRVLKVPNIKFL